MDIARECPPALEICPCLTAGIPSGQAGSWQARPGVVLPPTSHQMLRNHQEYDSFAGGQWSWLASPSVGGNALDRVDASTPRRPHSRATPPGAGRLDHPTRCGRSSEPADKSRPIGVGDCPALRDQRPAGSPGRCVRVAIITEHLCNLRVFPFKHHIHLVRAAVPVPNQ